MWKKKNTNKIQQKSSKHVPARKGRDFECTNDKRRRRPEHGSVQPGIALVKSDANPARTRIANHFWLTCGRRTAPPRPFHRRRCHRRHHHHRYESVAVAPYSVVPWQGYNILLLLLLLKKCYQVPRRFTR